MVHKKIYVAADHAGFDLKNKIIDFLEAGGFIIEDLGAFSNDPNDDYPDFISKVAKEVSADPDHSCGIVVGGSGQGEAIVANRFPNVRASVFYAPRPPVVAADIAGRVSADPYEMLKLTREHNDSNVLSLGARFLSEDEAKNAVQIWLDTSFSGDERHVRRIGKIESVCK